MSDETPSRTHRRPPSVKIEKWGLIEAWLGGEMGRLLLFGSASRGLQITAIDPTHGEQIEIVGPDEEPSSVALRAISRFSGRKIAGSP